MLLENVSALCKERNITIAELERETGLGNGTVRRWASMNPRVDLLKKVADYFGTTLDALYGDGADAENKKEGEQNERIADFQE